MFGRFTAYLEQQFRVHSVNTFHKSPRGCRSHGEQRSAVSFFSDVINGGDGNNGSAGLASEGILINLLYFRYRVPHQEVHVSFKVEKVA